MDPETLDKSTELADIKRVFETLLHQDWTIEGNTLEEVLENNHGLEGTRDGVRDGARILIESSLTDRRLDDLIFGYWDAGYEPEAEGFDGWREVLREIVRLCDEYGLSGSSVGR